jgi:hypothetical protein
MCRSRIWIGATNPPSAAVRGRRATAANRITRRELRAIAASLTAHVA